MTEWRTWWIAGDKAIPDGHIVPDKYLSGIQVIEIKALRELIKALEYCGGLKGFKLEDVCFSTNSLSDTRKHIAEQALSRLPRELVE